VEEAKAERSISTVRACRIMSMSRSAAYYKKRKDDSEVIGKLEQLAQKLPTRGFSVYYGRIRNEGLKWNHKRVRRVYKLLKLNIRRKRKRRLPQREKVPLQQPQTINQKWSMDFMSDALTDGRKFRTLNIIDDFNREVLALEADTSLPAKRVVRVLERVIAERGKPQGIRVDNGPEFISSTLERFCNQQNIALQFIKPGKPMQNGYVERFNRTYREDVLDAYLFDRLSQVREQSEEWMEDYNHFHPHSSLGGKSPVGYRKLLNCGKLPAHKPSQSLPQSNSDYNSSSNEFKELNSIIVNQLQSKTDLC
jgi:putative transposase